MLPTIRCLTWEEIGSAWFHQLVNCRQRLMSTIPKLTTAVDKSFVDDLVQTRYCKCESSLCTTRHWDLSCVPMICSSLIWKKVEKARANSTFKKLKKSRNNGGKSRVVKIGKTTSASHSTVLVLVKIGWFFATEILDRCFFFVVNFFRQLFLIIFLC